MRTGKFFINDQWIESNKNLLSLNPADESVFGKACFGSKNDVEKAVVSAMSAFNDWKTLLMVKEQNICLMPAKKS